MKKLFLLTLFIMSALPFWGEIITTEHIYVQVGQTITLKNNGYNSWSATETNLLDIANIEYTGYLTDYYAEWIIRGLVAGCMPFYVAKKSGSTRTELKMYVIHVVDVLDISLPHALSLNTGTKYKYNPIITDEQAATTLTWESSDMTVATIDTDGIVNVVGTGVTTITCTAANGVKAQSIVTASPLLVKSLVLDKQTCEMVVGESIKLSATIYPHNASSSAVQWLSSNENVAQVDDEGNVTAIGYGYCSIYVKADDGSGKFGRCLIHVAGKTLKGDVNDDGKVNLSDAKMVVDIFVGKE